MKEYRAIDYSKCDYLPDKNSNSNENMLFLRKTDETIWKPPLPFLRELSLSTDPLFLSNFSMTPVFVQILKTRYNSPPYPCYFRKLWASDMCYVKKVLLMVDMELWKWHIFIMINISCKSSWLIELLFP